MIGFSGDAITCWYDSDDGARATACGLAIQEAMSRFESIQTPGGTLVSLGVKVAVAVVLGACESTGQNIPYHPWWGCLPGVVCATGWAF